MRKFQLQLAGLATGLLLVAAAQPSGAVSVALSQATATFSQTDGSFLVGEAIDEDKNDNKGWAIYPYVPGVPVSSQTAVFETGTDVGFTGGSLFTFVLTQNYTWTPGHTLGRFRLAVTQDARADFADGLYSGGDVVANWSLLDPDSFHAESTGVTLTELEDHSLLAGGAFPDVDVYTVTAWTPLTGITGVRLEVLSHPSLPLGGPGRASNGNFVLTELEVDATAAPAAVPEPATMLLLGAGLAGFAGSRARRKKK